MAEYYARIKPYNPQTGCLVRSYTYGSRRFVESNGWYGPIPEAAARAMKLLRQSDRDPRAPGVFDVATREEVKEINAAERAAASHGTVQNPSRVPERTSKRAQGAPKTPDMTAIPVASEMNDGSPVEDDAFDPNDFGDESEAVPEESVVEGSDEITEPEPLSPPPAAEVKPRRGRRRSK